MRGFGVWGHPDAASYLFWLAQFTASGTRRRWDRRKSARQACRSSRSWLISRSFSDERLLQRLTGEAAIGHVRYATAGNGSVDNIQPFLFKFLISRLGWRTGNLTNAKSLRKSLESEGAIFHSNSDTEILMHLIRRSGQANLLDRIKEALNQVKGGFAYLC